MKSAVHPAEFATVRGWLSKLENPSLGDFLYQNTDE